MDRLDNVEDLGGGVLLCRSCDGDNTFVIIPFVRARFEILGICRQLAQLGLEMIDPDECEPETTMLGLKVPCVERTGITPPFPEGMLTPLTTEMWAALTPAYGDAQFAIQRTFTKKGVVA